jgi:hypothetical protein
MPMFGPGLSVELALCPAYAPISAAVSGGDARTGKSLPLDASMDMSGMDMSMDMPMTVSDGPSAPDSSPVTDSGTSAAHAPVRGSLPARGSGHQEHTICPYAASAVLAAPPVSVSLTVDAQSATEYALLAPQITYLRLARA